MSALENMQFGGLMSAPEPMSALTNMIITPENVAMEARLSRAKPLGWFQIQQLKREAARLEATAARLEATAPARETVLEMRERLKVMQTEREQLERDLELTPFDSALQTQFKELMAVALPLWKEYEAQKAQLLQLENTRKQAVSIRQRIADNPQVLARKKEEDRTLQIQREEAHAYEQLMIDRLTQLGLCYRWVDNKGNKRTDTIRFSWCEITPDAIFYKVAASHRTMFGAWRTKLPYGVRIADIVKEETCYELSLACQRQVTAKSSPTGGAWIIVHRLDTNDGLINQVHYHSVMEHYPKRIRALIPICVGVGLNLQLIWLNIAQYPHMLIAGFTGSGKSNFVNGLICTLISMHTPEEIRLVLVDLKDGLEFGAFERVPHLHGKVVDNLPALADSLQELEAIMSERNHLMRGKAKSLGQYNERNPENKLPRIICVIDEVASIMNQGDLTKRINHSLAQLTAKGRAPGIHIILSTQRPSVDVIPGNVKVNLAARIVGRMPSQVDSQTVLGTSDARDLANVPGRMLLQLGPDPQSVQTPLLEDEDIAAALKRAMQFDKPAPLPVPENRYQSSEWTPEKLVELSLGFLNGNISLIPIWNEIKDEGGISRSQLRGMLERVWQADCIPYGDKSFKAVRGAHGKRSLVEIIEDTKVPDSQIP